MLDKQKQLYLDLAIQPPSPLKVSGKAETNDAPTHIQLIT